jgi:hypothetical protein
LASSVLGIEDFSEGQGRWTADPALVSKLLFAKIIRWTGIKPPIERSDIRKKNIQRAESIIDQRPV